MSHPRILMCPPDHYGIEYEINAWMSRGKQADRDVAMEQWTQLRQLLVDAGASVELLEPQEGFPDLVFTANAGLVHRNRVVMSRFRPPQRRGELAFTEPWLASAGFEVCHLPEEMYFEGAGDALFCGDTLIAGYRIRSDARAQQVLGEMLGCRVIPLELVSQHYYHLDTCFCPLNDDTALFFPGAFDDYGKRALQEVVPNLIEIPDSEAAHFAGNAVVVGTTVVTNTGCPKVHARLAEQGFTPHGTPLHEFVKAGGSAKCLTLRLDGEDAAGWRRSAESG